MSLAALRVAEPSARYLATLEQPLLRGFDLLATAPEGVARLRELILSLAVRGKLVPQDPRDEPASVLLEQIRDEKEKLIAAGRIRREKALPEIGEEERPFELPSGWEWKRLGEVGSWAIGSGFPHSAQGRTDLPILFAKVSDMNLPGNEREIQTTNHTVSEQIVSDIRANIHPTGTVIFPKIGGAIATNKRRILVRPTAIDNNCLGITPSPAISTAYLYLYLTSIDFTEYQAGTSVPALSQGVLGEIIVGLPPFSEQSRIVARVEALMQLCDELEQRGRLEAEHHARLVATLFETLTASASAHELAENWQRIASHFDLLLDRPEAVDALEQTILQLAVRGLLVPQDSKDEPASTLLKKIRAEKDRLIAAGKIKRDKPLPPITDDEMPFDWQKEWEWVRFGDVTNISSGVTLGRKTPIKDPVAYPYLRVANVQRWRLALSEVKAVIIDRKELERFRLRRNDLLITEGGDWDKVGRTCIWRDEVETCLHQNHVFKVRGVSDEWNPLWAELYLNSADARVYFAGAAKQTTNLASINMSELKHCVFPLPPLAEQSRIVARVEELRALCAALRQRLSDARVTQSRLAETLVAQAA